MKLRSELQPPTLEPLLVDELTYLANHIIASMDAGEPYDKLIDDFNQRVHQNYTIADFDAAVGSIDMQAFVEIALRPQAQCLPDITDSEYIMVINYLREDSGSISEQAWWMHLLECNLPDPNLFALVYHRDDLSAAEVLLTARLYRPILL